MQSSRIDNRGIDITWAKYWSAEVKELIGPANDCRLSTCARESASAPVALLGDPYLINSRCVLSERLEIINRQSGIIDAK